MNVNFLVSELLSVHVKKFNVSRFLKSQIQNSLISHDCLKSYGDANLGLANRWVLQGGGVTKEGFGINEDTPSSSYKRDNDKYQPAE